MANLVWRIPEASSATPIRTDPAFDDPGDQNVKNIDGTPPAVR